MSNKINNKTLVGLLAVLLAIFAVAKWCRGERIESTLKTELVSIDTAKISQILLYPTSEGRQEIAFTKTQTGWKISKGKFETNADIQAVNNMLNTLREIKPQRLASKRKDKWAEYQLADTMATRVKVLAGKKTLADVLIGKFTYQQAPNQYGMGGGGGVTGTTFVRLNGENEIYAVDGFLVFTFNQGFNSFRNHTIARLDKPFIEKISFQYPADSSFTLTRNNGKWVADNTPADSASVDTYLNSLSYKSAQTYADNFSAIGAPVCKLSIETNDKKVTIIEAYPNGTENWAIGSSQNPGSWFDSNKNGVFAEIFIGKKKLLK